jgi:hypothetical protein
MMPPEPPRLSDGVKDGAGFPALEVGVESLEVASVASFLILAA